MSSSPPEPAGPAEPPHTDAGLHLLRFTRDGDLLVFDEKRPGEGFAQFYSLERNELRKFVREAVRSKLERVRDPVQQQSAFDTYRAYLATLPPPKVPTPRPAVAATHRAAAGAAEGTHERVGSNELAELYDRLDVRDPGPLFVTGRAGTGKSTVLRQLAAAQGSRCVVLAPTGLAALNAGGQTIHSFFRFPLKPLTARDIQGGRWMQVARQLDMLIIDEISMVRADVVDGIDVAMRLAKGNDRPFGGVRVVMFGDPFQLPPIVSKEQSGAFGDLWYDTPHFFDAAVFKYAPLSTVEFRTVYRQRDPVWIALLDRVRTATPTGDDYRLLHTRIARATDDELDETIILTARRLDAERVNQRRLDALDDAPATFAAERSGTFGSQVGTGTFKQDPAPDPLVLKRGARVMFVKNDPEENWVNGSLGEVQAISSTGVIVKLDSGAIVTVEAQEWQQLEYWYDDDANEIRQKVVGRYKQMPLQLAWAVTIHKSQGLTFDRVHVHLGRGAFSAGQTYVALSRCRTMEGMTLESPIGAGDVRCDPRVVTFMRESAPAVPPSPSHDRILP
ncbi:MAG: AAA family ATPase [Gemmatimonadota bacterium]|nr:AAA family ATPase [Gemmatimonadota bacterium]